MQLLLSKNYSELYSKISQIPSAVGIAIQHTSGIKSNRAAQFAAQFMFWNFSRQWQQTVKFCWPWSESDHRLYSSVLCISWSGKPRSLGWGSLTERWRASGSQNRGKICALFDKRWLVPVCNDSADTNQPLVLAVVVVIQCWQQFSIVVHIISANCRWWQLLTSNKARSDLLC